MMTMQVIADSDQAIWSKSQETLKLQKHVTEKVPIEDSVEKKKGLDKKKDLKSEKGGDSGGKDWENREKGHKKRGRKPQHPLVSSRSGKHLDEDFTLNESRQSYKQKKIQKEKVETRDSKARKNKNFEDGEKMEANW